MTGFGRAELRCASGSIRVEIKTVNHKFLEVSPRLPGHLSEYEDTLRRAVSQRISRGKVNLFVAAPDPGVFTSKLTVNEPLAKELQHKIRRLQSILGLKLMAKGLAGEKLMLKEVLHFPDVLSKDAGAVSQGAFTKDLEKVLKNALSSLDDSRQREGASLAKDITGRVGEIARSLKAVQKRIPVLGKQYKNSLKDRMSEFMKEGDIDRERLTVEVAQYLKNSDISEEVVRLATHLDAMKKALKEKGELGRKLDFIAQEMTREANTMGAKSSDAYLSEAVIAVKSAIEKIREQAQNIE